MTRYPDPYRDELLGIQDALEEIIAARQRIASYAERLDQLAEAIRRVERRRFQQRAKAQAKQNVVPLSQDDESLAG